MQNPSLKLFPSNEVICLKNWKLWRAPTTTQFNIFSSLPMSRKVYSGFFKILFRSWIIDKPGFGECVETRSFLIWQIIQDLNKIKNSRTAFCRHWYVENVCRISTKIIKLCSSWSSSKVSIFLTRYLVSRKQ